MKYILLNKTNVNLYLDYLKKGISREKEQFMAESIDCKAIKDRLSDPFYKRSKTVLAIENSLVLGSVEFHFYGTLQDGYRMAYVDWLYVLPEYRHKGIAQGLFQALEKNCRKNKIDQYYLIRSTNEDADRFYQHLGDVNLMDDHLLRKYLSK